ncbi:DUF1292 domain-containing protein [Cohnella faecalis]|uniref:DUF1292 domain-containing protein n=1 Tax=Cohnella faecalis TaxID=2315694 RepID=UPI001F1D340B|nr:DUF1292 domain-containing protein [Cohnella faecalis]
MSSLKQQYGDSVELTANGGKPQAYRILAEIAAGDREYAILQSEAMAKDGDIEVFRIVRGADGEADLETVEDDEEWERAAEAYDDLQFGSDEQP